MTTEKVAELGGAIGLIAVKAAQEYLRVHNLSANSKTLAEFVSFWCKAKLPEAMHDAKEAFDCGMTDIGLATFKATMAQAGIEAAKECGMPSPEVYQPKTGQKCHCRPGVWRDNCPDCEGTGWRIDFAAIRARH